MLTVTPVVKDAGGDILIPTNYRPIAMPKPLMRLYDSVIDSRLVGYLEPEGYDVMLRLVFGQGYLSFITYKPCSILSTEVLRRTLYIVVS